MCLFNMEPARLCIQFIRYKSANPETTQIRGSIGVEPEFLSLSKLSGRCFGGGDSIEPEGTAESMRCRQCCTHL